MRRKQAFELSVFDLSLLVMIFSFSSVARICTVHFTVSTVIFWTGPLKGARTLGPESCSAYMKGPW